MEEWQSPISMRAFSMKASHEGVGQRVLVPTVLAIILSLLFAGAGTAMPLCGAGIGERATGDLTRFLMPKHPEPIPVMDANGGSYPPIADTGPDVIVRAGELVSFDGTCSFDEDSTIVDYQWILYDGGWVFLSGPTPQYRFERATVAPIEVTLMVTDEFGSVGYDYMTVTVWPKPVTVAKTSPYAMAGTKTWSYATPGDGSWDLRIENHGLHSAVLYVVQRSAGIGMRVLTTTINFVNAGAYPSGVVRTPTIPMVSGWYYQVTATPLGAYGAYAVFDIEYASSNTAPVAAFSVTVDDLNVSVDASASYDPNTEPIMYAWDWGDGTNKASGVTATHTYSCAGDYRITLVVRDGAGLRDSSSQVVMVPPPVIDRIYVIYDLFQQPWGEWWWWRYPAYGTDIILNNTPGNYTMLYNPDRKGNQGIIYAPYRMNVTALNMTNLNVGHPEFMPVAESPVEGAQVSLDIYFEYLYWEWWNSTWKKAWGFPDYIMQGQTHDGWYLGVTIGATMNREAAEVWLGLPVGADASDWWSLNNASYTDYWLDWINYEGNVRLDIWAAYEWPFADLGTKMKLVELPNGDVRLEIAHISCGYEILMTRWLTEATVIDHEPHWEDFTLHAEYTDKAAWVTLDGVCQYSLHAVKQNSSLYDSRYPLNPLPGAWVWEPLKIDYVESWNTPGGLHKSQYDPWSYENGVMYQSWNAGDPSFANRVSYERAPNWFNLSRTEMLIIQLPRHNQVIGYLANKAPPDAIRDLIFGNKSYYESITIHGETELGFYISNYYGGGADLASMYDPVTKRLEIRGPLDFDNWRWPNGAIYHGAPWIEFNIVV